MGGCRSPSERVDSSCPTSSGSATLAEAVTSERCEIALGSIPHADDDPAGFVLALGELVRMGDDPDHWLPELVAAVEALGPTIGWDADAALGAAKRILASADERRAERDLGKILARRTAVPPPPEPPPGVRVIAWAEAQLAAGPELLPAGLPAAWLGQSLDVYGIPTGARSTVSYAIRWHGERPAILWEQRGESLCLTAPVAAPEWSSDEATGEALWPPPSSPSPSPSPSPSSPPTAPSPSSPPTADEGTAANTDDPGDEPTSFS